MRVRMITVSAVVAAATLGLATPALASPTPRPASAQTSSCALLLWYNSNEQGSSACYNNSDVANFAGDVFTSAGAGQGLPVKNDAASATDKLGYTTTWPTARIFFNSNWGGVYDDVAPQSSRNLSNTYNNNASLEWVL
ncbi:hypothetical protein SRB17_89370 [Streptomyces sp. RB17]|uniref:hypothetical protein n=1 Tax=Streptomyces sp. RB17 TaxID=2585197 RepID=UPI001294A9D6|nr:hypothetical protein [Streptomyces sp. RB17]MQY40904.1 hypothetical protein [Streptomyces sp. RB17]